MRVLSAKPTRMGTSIVVIAVLVLIGAVVFEAAGARALGIGESSYYSFSSSNCASADHTDPVGVLFRGTHAWVRNVADQVARHAGWGESSAGEQYLQVYTGNGNYDCRPTGFQRADHGDVPPSGRFHVRLWSVPASGPPEWKTVGTPHHEDLTACGHAVDSNGDEGSGFDKGRRKLRNAFIRGGHQVQDTYWGNTANFQQCDGDYAGSNGNGVVITVNHQLEPPRTRRPTSSTTQTTLNGTLFPEETTTDWWFSYGTKSAQGSGYPNKTMVRSSSSGTAAIDVSEVIPVLSPNTTYYVRMFARNQAGEVGEGNEFVYSTSPETDEDDNTAGPRLTVQSDGVANIFYRTVDNRLGHDWYVPSVGWAAETAPGPLASTSVPRAVTQPSGTVDIFYRTPANELGHDWWTQPNGWAHEVRSGSLASDPRPVVHSNGSVDVFYRTSSNELGHQWWAPGIGWSTETRPGTLSSDPHVVTQANGTVDVFYRSGSDLGHDSWTSANGWSHEVRSGPLAGEPHPIAHENGIVDVFYRTTANTLGHDWFLPGNGWSHEIRPGSLASDPRVVTQPNGAVDVFYRTSSNELGHQWWAPGIGWSTETRAGTLSSDPHVVAQANGTVDVFYRSGNQIGHHWYVPGKGWSVETRPGPIASGTDPHLAAQSDGTIDVVYFTPTGQLGHDWYVPGKGWSHEERPAGAE